MGTRPGDRALAGSQHGIVSIAQLRRMGLGRNVIRQRVAGGQLHPLHRGVYAVGHPAVSDRGVWLAAVLAFGDGAVLSHRSAAALWGLLLDGNPRVEVTAPRRGRSTRAIRTHCCSLAPEERSYRYGIPVTTVERTLIDVAAAAPHLLERACNEAEVKGLVSADALSAVIGMNPGRRGVARLRAIARIGCPSQVRSELERRFLALIAREGLPRPDTGILVEADDGLIECDCIWRDQRLIVELDGRRYHDTAIAFERDRSRDRRLQAEGWQVVRVTWNQLHEPEPLLADLRRLLLRRT